MNRHGQVAPCIPSIDCLSPLRTPQTKNIFLILQRSDSPYSFSLFLSRRFLCHSGNSFMSELPPQCGHDFLVHFRQCKQRGF